MSRDHSQANVFSSIPEDHHPLIAEALRVTEEERVLLADMSSLSADDCLVLMAELGRRQAELRTLLNKLAGVVGLPTGARQRILRYLLLTQGKVVDKDELSGVAGIYEWARRVRELRVEEGWPISSNENRPTLDPGQYVLESTAPDDEIRARWETANRIRNMAGSASSRILAFLRGNVGKPVSQDELFYVAKIPDYSGCIRELVQEGWSIESNLDRRDLEPGQFALKEDKAPYDT
jgi:hypothetical protein